MAFRTWSGTLTGNYQTAGNWLEGAVPTSDDRVRIPAGSAAITAGLNNSSYAVHEFIVDEGYTNTIATSSAYLEILVKDSTGVFRFGGTGTAYIDVNASAISLTVTQTANAGQGASGLLLKGTAMVTASVEQGYVGIGARHGEAATVTTTRLVGANANVRLGTNVTATTVVMFGGSAEIQCPLTTLTMNAGIATILGIGPTSTINCYGGTVYPESAGTITNLNIDRGGHANFMNNGIARTVTNLKLNPTGQVSLDRGYITVTTWTAPDQPIRLAASAANAG